MQCILTNTIYAGINVEKWTGYKAVKCKFDGLISIDLFNRANQGKKYIAFNAEDGEYEIQRQAPKKHLVDKVIKNADFPYKKLVLCPECSSSLLGSASRGKNGKYYPAYHCSNRGHYFRVRKDDMDKKITEFIGRIKVNDKQIETLISTIRQEFERRQSLSGQDSVTLDKHIKSLQMEAEATIGKIMLLTNPTAITYLEAEIEKIHQQITKLEKEKKQMKQQKPINIERILARVRFFMENFDALLIRQQDPHKKAQLFGVLFNQLPTYEDLNYGTQKTPLFTGVNPVFALAGAGKSDMVNLKGANSETLLSSLFDLATKLAAQEEKNV